MKAQTVIHKIKTLAPRERAEVLRFLRILKQPAPALISEEAAHEILERHAARLQGQAS